MKIKNLNLYKTKMKKLGLKFHRNEKILFSESVTDTMIIFLQGIKDFSDRSHGCFFTDQSKVRTRIPLCFLLRIKIKLTSYKVNCS